MDHRTTIENTHAELICASDRLSIASMAELDRAMLDDLKSRAEGIIEMISRLSTLTSPASVPATCAF